MLHHGMIATGDHFDLDSLRGAQRPTNVPPSTAARPNGPGRWTDLVGGVLHSAAIQISMIAGGDHTITYMTAPYYRSGVKIGVNIGFWKMFTKRWHLTRKA